MKPEPEPLKNKTQSHCHKKDKTDRHDIHDDVDIKSAVEWLKEYILDCREMNSKNLIKIDFVIERIDEAFEDVGNKTKRMVEEVDN